MFPRSSAPGKPRFDILRWHIVVAHFLTQGLGERGGHLRSRQVSSRDADGFADELTSFLEDAVGALAMSSAAMPGSFLSPMGSA